MEKEKKIALSVGLLFIITMILGMIDAYTVAPILQTPLENIFLNKNRVIIGTFSILFMSIGVVGISILLFPILEKHNKFIAITYISFRVMECLLLIIGVIVYLLLITLSKNFINAGSPDGSYFQMLSTLAIEMRYNAYHIAMIILSIGSIMMCYLFYKVKLIPRFIAVVGLAGYILVFVSAPLDILDIIDTTSTGGMLYIPGAIFEILLLPAWLIIKGFNSSFVNSITT